MTESRPRRWLVQVCQHRSCLRNRSDEVLLAFRDYQSAQILVAETGCMGQCSAGPTVRILPDDTWYCRISPEQVPRIVKEHLMQGKPVAEYRHPRFHPSSED